MWLSYLVGSGDELSFSVFGFHFDLSSHFKFAYISFPVSKTTRELILEWNHLVPVDLSSDMKMPQFKVEEVETDICEESSMIGTTIKFKLQKVFPVSFSGYCECRDTIIHWKVFGPYSIGQWLLYRYFLGIHLIHKYLSSIINT